MIRYVPGHDRLCTDQRTASDHNPAQNGRIGSQSAPFVENQLIPSVSAQQDYTQRGVSPYQGHPFVTHRLISSENATVALYTYTAVSVENEDRFWRESGASILQYA